MADVGIYKITSPTNKIYIGQSRDIGKRLAYYRKAYCKFQTRLYHSILKYGFDAHVCEKLLLPIDVDQTTLNNFECFLIDQYKEAGYYMLNIRDGGSNGSLSAESKEKLSIAHKGNKHRLGKFGARLSKETREKMRLSRLGKPSGMLGLKASDETKLKMSKSQTGRKHSQETIEKMRAHASDAAARLIVAQMKTRKAVVQVSLEGNVVKVWESGSEAARSLGVDMSSIFKVCSGDKYRHSIGGFNWFFKEDYAA